LRQTRQPEEEDTARETDSSEDDVERKREIKKEPKIRRHDPLVYSSKSCTFDQDYLNLLTFDPVKDLSLSDEEEEKEEAPKVAPRADTFKPYVKKEHSSGFGFWSSGLEDSLLSGSGFSYRPSARTATKPVKKTSLKANKDEQKGSTPPTLTSTNALSASAMMRS